MFIPNPRCWDIHRKHNYFFFRPTVQFINESLHATSYLWNFGDGNTSIVEHPIHTYPGYGQNFVITLLAMNEIGCTDTAQKTIVIKEDLILFVPNTFTPNADDANNVFKPVLAQGYKENSYNFKVYNRWVNWFLKPMI